MSPAELRRTGWIELVDCVIVAPAEPTYVSGDTSSLIDFFVVHPVLAHDVSCAVFHTTTISKHQPV
eukprot:6842377-Pyramimonas_sp.AAC.1